MTRLPASAQLSIQRYGKRTRLVESAVVVSFTAPGTEALPNNPNRLEWFASNGGANAIHITRRIAPTTTLGALLAASGGVVSESGERVGEVVSLPVRMLAETADTTIYLYEIVADVAEDK